MAKVNINIWHNANGQIVAIGHATATKHKVIPIAGENQFIFETEIDESQIEGLHRTHIVDMNAKALVKHPAAKPTR
jgi:hypothetical protein